MAVTWVLLPLLLLNVRQSAGLLAQDKLQLGETLWEGEFLESRDRWYRLVVQEDGNLVGYMAPWPYRPENIFWESKTERVTKVGSARLYLNITSIANQQHVTLYDEDVVLW
eukprot:Hpha_TRINITY_DN5989_c0_g1::TRINITY_DN5989_c0_g1_i1::g.147278::m.147278